MAARDYLADAKQGLILCDQADTAQGAKAIVKRRLGGGNEAIVRTPGNVPVIREWEYAQGQVIVFAPLLSCLGAIQIVDANIVLGAHFSQYEFDSIAREKPFFSDCLKKAGFDQSKPIIYIGGLSVAVWKEGLGQTSWWKASDDSPTWGNVDERAWIVEVEGGALTHETFR